MYVSNLSRDYIYKTFSQESIFEAYGIPVVKGLFVSPLRKDKNPTCAFQYRNGILKYYDNRPGEVQGDAVSMVMHMKNLNFQEALLDIYKTLSKSQRTSIVNNTKTLQDLKPASTEIKMNFREFSAEDLKYWNQYNIYLDTLTKFNIKSCKEVYIKNKDGEFFNCKKNDELCFAYFFPDNSVKVYFPRRDKYRFISNSRYIQGINFVNNPNILVITKSYKDVICLSLFGIQAVAMQGESVLPPRELIEKFNCVYLGDNDVAGKKACVLIKRKYGIPIYLFSNKYRNLGIKDFSDAFKVLGQDELKNLLSKILCVK